MTCARSCGVSPTATNCKCLCRRRGRWRADRSPGSSPQADAIRMNGRRKRTACSSTTTKAASPPRLWIRNTAVSSPDQKISRCRWLHSSCRGWTPVRPPAALPAIWVWRPFTNAARRSKGRNMSVARRRSNPAKTGNKSAPHSRSPSPSRLSASRPECSAAKCAWPSGRTVRNRCCRWRNADGSSRTWALPMSSRLPWIRTTNASRAVA